MQGLVTRSIPVRRFTHLDAMVLTGASTVGCWTGAQTLFWPINAFPGPSWTMQGQDHIRTHCVFSLAVLYDS
jgi:hypothetical protein